MFEVSPKQAADKDSQQMPATQITRALAELGIGRISAHSPQAAHYHNERNHQGLTNRVIQPDRDHLGNTGAIQRRERLGGMLNYYYRTAA